MLAELFEKARSAAAQRPADGPAAVVQLIVGDDAYVIDTRTNTPPHLVIRAERVQNADVEVSLDVATLVALLDGSLPPLRAWTQKLIRVKGDHKQLRALEWLSSVAGGKARSASSMGGATVQVRSANGDAGHGVYELQVTEEAACWTVWRRWSELKQLSTELSAEFGAGAPLQIHCTMHACRMHATCTPHVHVHRMHAACACTGTPFNLALPSLKAHALRSSGSAALLSARRRQMQAFLSTVTQQLPVSPRTSTGPAPPHVEVGWLAGHPLL